VHSSLCHYNINDVFIGTCIGHSFVPSAVWICPSLLACVGIDDPSVGAFEMMFGLTKGGKLFYVIMQVIWSNQKTESEDCILCVRLA